MDSGYVKKSINHSSYAKILLILFISLTLAGCTDTGRTKPETKAKNGDVSERKEPGILPVREWKLPIRDMEGEFYKAFGWLADNKILYGTNIGAGTNLYSYSLETGKSELLLKSVDPIVTVSLNQQRTRLMVQTSPSSYEAVVTVYDQDGMEAASQSFPSAELQVEWNPYKEDELLVVAFKEDWTYQTFLMRADDRTVEEITIANPFAKWIGKDRIAYLDWNEEDPSFFAPLVIKGISGDGGTQFDDHIYHIEGFKGLILAISTEDETSETANYTFYDQELKVIDTINIPHLARFSDWLIPYNSFNGAHREFTVFEPKRGGDADTYTEGFTLASYTLNGKREVILGNADNQPIDAAMNGKAILYGFRLERIIDVESKKTLDLLEEKPK